MGEHKISKNQTTADYQIFTARMEALEAELNAMRNSTIWRASAPLRRLIETVRGIVLAQPRLVGLLRRGRGRLFLGRYLGALKQDEGSKNNGPTLLEIKESFKRESEAALQAFLAGEGRLRIPSSEQPRVSIIIILYNQAAMTYKCLRSLSQDQGVPFEVILFDNASLDETAELMTRVDGVRYTLNSENSGFLLAVNRAARLARGEHLLLLNNDTEMHPGTLSRAVRRLEMDAGAGAVGGKIILPDGTLQEAGSIVWQDGSCLGYGRGERPDDARFQFVRQVDYCSGAFLLVRRSLFDAMGGFDPDYAPAYYEESDFCVRLAKQGYTVVYDPCVEISHFEFASAGSQDKALELQWRNRQRLVEKHRDYLARKSFAGSSSVLAARDLTHYKGRILFIEDRVPHSALGTGYPRARSIVHELCVLGWFVTFYPLVVPQDDWTEVYKTLPERVEVMLDCGIGGLQAFLTSRQDYYDYVLVSRPHNMLTVQLLHDQEPGLFKGMRIVYDAEAVFALRAIKQAQVQDRFYSPVKLKKMLEEELSLAKSAHCIMAVSQTEAAQFSQAGCQKVEVISHMLTPRPGSAAFPERNGLLFVGALTDDASPNVDSLEWFITQVIPELNKIVDELPYLTVIGLCTSVRAMQLSSNSVRILGRVEDLSHYYNQARIFLAPTRFAAGVPHKAHEAASYGVPMVTTSLIASQLDWQDGKELLAADEPHAFAAAVARLYSEQTLWQDIRQNALDRVAIDCSRATFVAGLERIFTFRDGNRSA